MDVLLDPLYGIIISLAVMGVGFYLGFAAENKLGWILVVLGGYWLWAVLGHQGWGIPPAPWPA